jgi:anti-anti-sigma factor
MEIRKDKRDGVAVIIAQGRLDSTTSEGLEQALLGSLNAGERKIVVDLAGVDYISSAGLRVLLMVAKRLGVGRNNLVLCGLGDAVRQVFDLAGFLPLFTVEATRDLAVARLAVPA